jgi:16S rRNA (guanine527-N7)-methyltransferase
VERLINGAERLGLLLNPEQVARFKLYYEELICWNRRVNLTAIVDYDEVQLKHFLDSLTVVLALEGIPSTVLDIGSGAGLPGVPLKILYPDIGLTLIDSVHKKAAFLNHLVERLGLEGVEVVARRAELLAHDESYREGFDLVLSRGVARLSTLSELALPFCTPGGAFIAMKKGDIDDEVASAARAIGLLGGQVREVRRVSLGKSEVDGWMSIWESERRVLVVIEKRTPTHQSLPRRPGIPQKRPL